MSEIRYPDVVVPMVGQDGNAGAIMGRVGQALRRQGGATSAEVNEFRYECMRGNYDELLQTVMRWVTVE